MTALWHIGSGCCRWVGPLLEGWQTRERPSRALCNPGRAARCSGSGWRWWRLACRHLEQNARFGRL